MSIKIIIEKTNGKSMHNVYRDEKLIGSYDQVGYFYSGIAKVRLNNKFGFINEKGEEITEIKYERADEFSAGYAGVSLGGKWGFINAKGEEICKMIYDQVVWFDEGKAKVFKDGKGLLNDKNGNEFK